ncbi:DUF2235 domain-containing protein [Caballeronia sp. SEWSISQ10-4 2]|uniref:DUF2235 domain-containing protein n=1 Tax=Caballeronia sp. SEWSISQ10-4 2 TaxID=2937438 RepID=UPI00264C02A0|nr:DUF2235 domain-containing protein [Caballeronia sp. SEWSISQ10-4 2]MDN7178777.1 DUF2235 domain-containing protein [Caballeronia sp. SEWSISQ10-4 2]
MPKNIVLLSDGTGNSSAKAQKTNVWRMFEALDQTNDAQIAFYDDGVGSSTNKYLALAGGAFGWGLKRNVIDIYKFLCRNYEPGDQISGFGFSRGAFTIRTVVGLIDSEGVVIPESEEQLDRDARSAYRHYRSARFPSKSPIVRILRGLRDLLLSAANVVSGRRSYAQGGKHHHVPIRFLGLWDAVSAYGVPILPLKRAISATVWPMMFGDLKLSKHVERACHALSLDDERSTFHPLLWDEAEEPQLAEEGETGADDVTQHEPMQTQVAVIKKIKPGRITQVWFPGVHCNVGGGYPEDRLSLVSLHWIMSEANAAGIHLLPSALLHVVAAQSPFARIYDSRKGFAGGYPYLPRLALPCLARGKRPYWPIVHWSVVVRIAFGTDRYAPIAVRESFQVLDPSGLLQPFPGDQGEKPIPLLRPSEAAAQLEGIDQAWLGASHQRLNHALDMLKTRSADAMALAWDTVFWRRIAYLATLVLSALVILFPYFGGGIEWLEKLTRRVTVTSNPARLEDDVLNTLLTAIKGVLPAWSTPWTNAFGEHSSVFALLLALWLISLQFGAVLRKRVHDRGFLAWHAERCLDYLEWRQQSEEGSRNMTLVAALVFTVAAMVVWFELGAGQLTTWEMTGAAVVLVWLVLWRKSRVKRLARTRAAIPASNATPSELQSAMKGGFALSLARSLRTSNGFRGLCHAMERVVLPAICLVVVFLFGGALLNRVILNGMSAVGGICKAQDAHTQPFLTSDPCWDSGITLNQGARYEITLATDGDWLDRSARADVGGFGTDTVVHFFAVWLRRWWFEDWFKPIARIGVKGHDEYVLEPEAPFALYKYANKLRAPALATKCSTQGKCDASGGHFDPMTRCEAACIIAGDPTPAARKLLVAQITAKTTGPLFLYVNDAVLPIFGKLGLFYGNNYGCAQVTVEQVIDERNRLSVGQSSVCPTDP